jgi:adenylate cyclase
MQRLSQFNQARSGTNLPPISIGVGIHTGRLVSGYIGSSRALSYTVIGDTANTSARLCGVAQPGQILVSQATLDQLGGRFSFTKLPAVSLKGKADDFQVYQIDGRNTSVQVPETVGAADR